MSKSASLGVILTLLIGSFFVAGPIHGWLEGRVHAPAAASAETAVHPVSVYKPSTQKSADVQPSEAVAGAKPGLWVYHWTYTTPATSKEVRDYYQFVYKNATVDASTPGVTVMTITPAGATANETARITVHDGSPTAIDLILYVIHTDTVIGTTSISVLLSAVLLLLFFVATGQAGHLFGVYKKVASGTRYEELEAPPTDAAVLKSWADPQKALQAAGFSHVLDYRVASASYANFVRLLHKGKTTYAALTYARLGGVPHRWIEMVTHFTDGTSVVTTTSKFATGTMRPFDYPWHQIAEETKIPQVIEQHHQDVLLHEAQNHIATAVSPDGVLKLWQKIEKTIEDRGPVLPPVSPTILPASPAVADLDSDEVEPPVAEAPAVVRALPQAPVNVDSPEKREAFCNEVMNRIRDTYTDLIVTRKEGLIITTSKKTVTGSVDLDLTALYAQFREKPEGVIATYVRSLSTRF